MVRRLFIDPDMAGQCWRLLSGDQTVIPSAPTFSLPSHCRPTSSNFADMSQAVPAPASASTSSSNFQSIFNAALKAYEKKTKSDLLAHPLAAQLQACKSPGDILAVLQERVKEFDQSRGANERLSQWLDPTINVLYSFSATIGAGVGLVSSLKSTCLLRPLISHIALIAGILARIRRLLWYWGSPPGERAPNIVRPFSQRTMSQAAKDVEAGQDTLIDLFEHMENFFKRLESHTAVPPTDAMTDIIVKIMIEVLNIFAIATKEIRQGRASASPATIDDDILLIGV